MTPAPFAAGLALAVVAAAVPAQRPGQAQRLPAGAPPATQACVGCHGARGGGNPDAGAPRIAGQSQRYLRKQLDSFAQGSRRSAVMQPIARGLPPEVRSSVAAYFAGLDTPGGRISGEPPARGRALALQGDNALGVQACRNCHGPGGVGEPPNIPYLAGLDANYLAKELRAWKEGTRTNDAGQQMFRVATALPASDIEAVARYYESLPPPAPPPHELVQAPPPRTRPQGPARTAPARRESSQGSGVEQGAPTTGGAQGPGGGGASETGQDDGGVSGDGENRKEPGSPQPGGGDQSRAPAGLTWPGLSDAATKASAGSNAVEIGRALIESGAYGCQGCHHIPGIRWPRGIVGPPLAGFARRSFIAGQLPNDRDTLAAFLQNPPALIPRTGMPDIGLTLGQARQIAAFLHTLDGCDAP